MRAWLADRWPELAVGVACAAIVILVIAGSIYSSLAWQEFSAEHHCKLTRKISASSGVGFGTKGEMTVVTVAGKDCFLCDDGVEYCR